LSGPYWGLDLGKLGEGTDIALGGRARRGAMGASRSTGTGDKRRKLAMIQLRTLLKKLNKKQPSEGTKIQAPEDVQHPHHNPKKTQ